MILDEEEDDEDSISNEEWSSPEPLCINNQTWIDDGEVLVDSANHFYFRSMIRPMRDTSIEVRSELEYFNLMFPTQMWPQIVEKTNHRICMLKSTSEVSWEDLLKYLGIRLVMAVEGRHRRISSYWSTEKEEDSVFEPPRYGERFQMSRDRFQAISTAFRLDDFEKDNDFDVRSCFLHLIFSSLYSNFDSNCE